MVESHDMRNCRLGKGVVKGPRSLQWNRATFWRSSLIPGERRADARRGATNDSPRILDRFAPSGLADVNKAHRIANSVRAGTVGINCYDVFDAAAP